MARKLSGGLTGSPSVGALNVAPTAVVTAATNQDITLSPDGTASVVFTNNAILNAQSDLRFGDADSSNWVAFQAPATISSNVTWTLPAADGTSGQVLSTNASGTLSWVTAAVAITDNTSDSNTNYLTFTTATTGAISAARVSTTGLSFQPSTGLLTTSELTVNGTARALRTENTKTSSHTLELADRDRVVSFNGTGSQTVTVPTNAAVAFPTGTVIYINRVNTGALTLAASGGVTVSKTGSFALNEEAYLRKRGSDSWIVIDAPTTFTATGGSVVTSSGYRIHSFTTAGSASFDVV